MFEGLTDKKNTLEMVTPEGGTFTVHRVKPTRNNKRLVEELDKVIKKDGEAFDKKYEPLNKRIGDLAEGFAEAVESDESLRVQIEEKRDALAMFTENALIRRVRALINVKAKSMTPTLAKLIESEPEAEFWDNLDLEAAKEFVGGFRRGVKT